MPDETDKSACRRCGTCCRKGGPAFHRGDRAIVEKGIVQLKDLFTIREGEPAWDNVGGGVRPAPSDIIKIKSRPGRSTCAFYNEEAAACDIYRHRPAECRVLDCRDTRKIEAIYARDRLGRRDLLEGVPGLWELVADHHQQCSYGLVLPLAEEVRQKTRREALEELLYLVRYDLHLRELVVEKGGSDAGMLDFLFGRPLIPVLEGLGVRIRKAEGRLFAAFS